MLAAANAKADAVFRDALPETAKFLAGARAVVPSDVSENASKAVRLAAALGAAAVTFVWVTSSGVMTVSPEALAGMQASHAAAVAPVEEVKAAPVPPQAPRPVAQRATRAAALPGTATPGWSSQRNGSPYGFRVWGIDGVAQAAKADQAPKVAAWSPQVVVRTPVAGLETEVDRAAEVVAPSSRVDQAAEVDRAPDVVAQAPKVAREFDAERAPQVVARGQQADRTPEFDFEPRVAVRERVAISPSSVIAMLRDGLTAPFFFLRNGAPKRWAPRQAESPSVVVARAREMSPEVGRTPSSRDASVVGASGAAERAARGKGGHESLSRLRAIEKAALDDAQRAGLPDADPAPDTPVEGPRMVSPGPVRAVAQRIMRDFSPLSRRLAEGVHPDLLAVAALARRRSGLDFEIVPGNGARRTYAVQQEIVASGASHSLGSRHVLGLALDLIPMRTIGGVRVVDFFNRPGTDRIYAAMKAAAAELGVPMKAGMDWKSFPDPDHFELNHRIYEAYNPTAPVQMLYAAAAVLGVEAGVLQASVEAKVGGAAQTPVAEMCGARAACADDEEAGPSWRP
jgi:peptidoglycan L-alanyl-D-glutamate endopeptidase CwlK